MLTSVFIAAFVAVACAAPLADPPRPEIPASFVSEVHVQSRQPSGGVIFGEGIWAIDYKNNRAVEDYKLHDPPHVLPFNIFHLSRYDLGESFSLESFEPEDCQERQVTGHLPDAFAWVKNATYIGADLFHHIEVDIWGAKIGPVDVELYVRSGEANVPLAFNTRGHHVDFGVEFTKFEANETIDSKYFDVPSTCQSAVKNTLIAKPIGEDPQRPSFPSTFFSEVFVQTEEEGHLIDGKGIWAVDYKDNVAVEDYKLHRPIQIHDLYIFRLLRGDKGEAYEVDSTDFKDCRERVDKGHVDAWGWVQNATYIGKNIYHHIELDLWELAVSGAELRVGVRAGAYDIPVFFETRFRGGGFQVEFSHFTGNATFDHRIFDVPPQCSS